jgi:hypothetical protein
MKFYKFSIISEKDVQSLEDTNEDILLNAKHIVSIKPINIMTQDGVLTGYWIRMSNGKKYRAIHIPKELEKALVSS